MPMQLQKDAPPPPPPVPWNEPIPDTNPATNPGFWDPKPGEDTNPPSGDPTAPGRTN